MSLRLEMVQVSRLAPRLLGDSTQLVRDFVVGQLTPDGAFVDRVGKPDLYYTVFGLNCLQALQEEIPETVRTFLRSFGSGESLDLVHLACLARAWSAAGGLESETQAALLERLAAFRSTDGGFATEPGQAQSAVTSSFLAFGAYQDLGGTTPDTVGLIASVQAREAADGGYVNEPPAVAGSTPATTAAIALLGQLRQPPAKSAVKWLNARHIHGGFAAAPGLDMPDLLSTAVVLHALATLQRPLQRFVEPGLDFIDTLWTNRGAFHGHWADDDVDCEYTFYGLLALGHLSVWADGR